MVLIWKTTSFAAPGVVAGLGVVAPAAVLQLAGVAQVALSAPSQYTVWAWRAGALRARVVKETSGIFLSFIVGLLDG